MTARELFSALYVPVLAGPTARTLPLARRLFWRYGATAHLLSARQSFAVRLTPWVIPHPLSVPNDTILAMALLDLARDIAAEDRQPLLVLPTGSPALTPALQTALETHYLICREDDLSRLLAPLTGPLPTPKEDHLYE